MDPNVAALLENMKLQQLKLMEKFTSPRKTELAAAQSPSARSKLGCFGRTEETRKQYLG